MCDDTVKLIKKEDEPTSSVEKYLTELANKYPTADGDVNKIIQLCTPKEIEILYNQGRGKEGDGFFFNFFCIDVSGLDAYNENKKYIMLILFNQYTSALLDVNIPKIDEIQTNINIPVFFKINNSESSDDDLNEVNFKDNLLLMRIFIDQWFENFFKKIGVFIILDQYKQIKQIEDFFKVIQRKLLSLNIYIYTKNSIVEDELIQILNSIESQFKIDFLIFKIIFYEHITEMNKEITEFNLDKSFYKILQYYFDIIIKITEKHKKNKKHKQWIYLTLISLLQKEVQIEFKHIQEYLIQKMNKYENKEFKLYINNLLQISNRDYLEKKILEDKFIMKNFPYEKEAYKNNLIKDLENLLAIPNDKDYKFFNTVGEIIKEYMIYYSFSDDYKEVMNKISNNYLSRLSDEALIKEFSKPITKSKKKKKIGGTMKISLLFLLI